MTNSFVFTHDDVNNEVIKVDRIGLKKNKQIDDFHGHAIKVAILPLSYFVLGEIVITRGLDEMSHNCISATHLPGGNQGSKEQFRDYWGWEVDLIRNIATKLNFHIDVRIV